MSAVKEHPKVFISYSWSGPEHEQFVLNLATSLRTNGVDAIFDKWRLKPGQDKYVFMESMVTDPQVIKVLVLCDREYKNKADERRGGVGTESQIISQELYSQVDQTKFIPIICERSDDGKEFLPVFMKGRVYVDLSGELYGQGLEKLLRLIFDQPQYPEPSLGAAPTFFKPGGDGLPMARELPSALRSLKDGTPNREGLAILYVRSVLSELDLQYVKPDTGTSGYDEEIYQSILKTKGLRDQFSEYADAIALFSGDDPTAMKSCTFLLEQLGDRFGPPTPTGRYSETWADIYKFFALEAVLIITAALLRHERWQTLRHLLKYPYLVRTGYSAPDPQDITAFDRHIVSMDEHRNNRLKANRICITADMLRERCTPDYTSYSELVQADIFLALYAVARFADATNRAGIRYWRPRTAVYWSEVQSLPIFSKAVDSDIRSGIRKALDVKSAADLAQRVEAARVHFSDFKDISPDRFSRFNFVEATNLPLLIQP